MPTDGPTPNDRIDELLVGCLEGPATAWGRRVEAICADAPALAEELRRRFDKLIALGIIERPGIDASEATPERLGHYRLLRRLVGGGMGVVYEARDEKLDRRVALKIIRGEQRFFAGSRARFAREMQAASRLDHPHLCPIYEAGEIDGVQYIAMRYVEGHSLAALLKERRRERPAAPASSRGSSTRRRLEDVLLVEKTDRALHAAHQVGIVHRDVKPANVLIDADGEPVLVDFGLAHETDSSEAGLTHTGERLGTPAYMAPEQVSGRGAIDRRTDVYGLGATLYECLTLRCPFESAAREDLYSRILSEPPSDPRAFDRSIGSELAVVVGKALEKDPKDRFATAEEFAEELRRIRAHEPIRSRRPGLVMRTVRWTQRNRAAAGILAATLVGLAVSMWFLRQSTLAGTRFRALAWLQAAGSVEHENPELAFKCAREALRLHDDPVIVAKIQEIMFRMRENTVLLREPGSLRFIRFSPDGRFLVLTGPPDFAALLRRDGSGWRRLPFPDRPSLALWTPPVFSADSQELAIISPDTMGVLRYDLRGEAPRELPALLPREEESWRAWSVTYAPDPGDERILVVDTRGARLWNRDGRRLADLPGIREKPGWGTAAFLPDGRIAAIGRLLTGDGRELPDLPRLPNGPSHIAVGEDRLFLGWSNIADQPMEDAGQICAFDLDGRLLESIPPIPQEEGSISFLVQLRLDRTGTRLLACSSDERVRLYDAATLDLLREWTPEDGGEMRFSPDGSRIAEGAWSGLIRIRSLAGKELDVLSGHEGGVSSLDWSPDGKELVSVGHGGSARIWSLGMREGVPAYAGHGRPDVAVSPGGQSVAFTSETDGAVILCDASGGLRKTRALEVGYSSARFTRDGESIVVSNHRRKEFFLWSTEGEGHLQELEAPGPLGWCPPELLPDGRWLLHGPENQVTPWGGERSYDSPIPDPSRQQLYRFELSADGTRVLFCGFVNVFLFTVDGAELWRPKTPQYGRFVCFSPDGRHVLVAASSHAYLWNLDDPERAATVLRGHQNDVICAVFSHDGKRIATAAENGSIRIWDRASLRTILRLSGAGFRSIAFTATGQLVSAGTDGRVCWWWLDVEPLRRAVERFEIGGLTEAERDGVGHLLGD